MLLSFQKSLFQVFKTVIISQFIFLFSRLSNASFNLTWEATLLKLFMTCHNYHWILQTASDQFILPSKKDCAKACFLHWRSHQYCWANLKLVSSQGVWRHCRIPWKRGERHYSCGQICPNNFHSTIGEYLKFISQCPNSSVWREITSD